MDAERGRKRMTGLFSYTKTPIGAEQPPILRVKRLSPDAQLPIYATDGSARFDLYCHRIIKCGPEGPNTHCNIRCGTGLAVEVPLGWELNIVPRSGLAITGGLNLANCVGVIDPDYRGEIIIVLTNYDGAGYQRPLPGERIAQAKLARAPRCTILEVEELTETARGTGGFGSTGR